MLNSVVLQGRLATDPELRYTPSNVAVTSFPIAVERSYVKSGAERQVDFFDVVAWRNTAEFICNNFHKGQAIALVGELQTREYTDKNNIKRKVVEVIASQAHFCDNKVNKTTQTSFDEEPYNDDLPF